MKPFSNWALLLVLAGMLSTAPVSLSGQNNALDFDGIDDYVDLNSNGLLGTRTTFTIEAWVNLNNATTWMSIYGEFPNVSGFNDTRNYFSVNNGKVFFDQWRPSGAWLESSTTLTPGTWTHIAYTQHPGRRSLYINGILDTTDTAVETYIGLNPNRTWVGARHNPISGTGAYFGGKLDELRIWNKERTASEIQSTMNNELNGTEANLITYYNFNEGIANGSNPTVFQMPNQISGPPQANLRNFTLNGNSSNWVGSTTLGPPQPPSSVPTLSEWGLLVLSLLVLCLGAVALRRRQQGAEVRA